MERKKASPAVVFLLLVWVAVLTAACVGNSTVPEGTAAPFSPASSVLSSITVTPETPEDGAQEIAAQEPMAVGESREYHPYILQYQGLSSVSLTLPSGERELRDAIDSGEISAAQLIAQAEADASQGLCEQRFSCSDPDTKLCWTVYQYPGFSMGVMTDMYVERLSEKQYLFKYVVFAPAGGTIQDPSTLREDDETFVSIHTAPWDLTTTPQDITPNGLTLHCALSDDYFDGEVYLGEIVGLARKEGDDWKRLEPLTEPEPLSEDQVKALGRSIPTGGEADYPISWEESYGSLESGTYNLRIYVRMGKWNGGITKVTFTIP